MARARAKAKTELQVIPSEAREHRLKLGEMTDSEVVQASLDGDSRAFNDLVRRYDQRLLNFVYRTIGDRERGQDLTILPTDRILSPLMRWANLRTVRIWWENDQERRLWSLGCANLGVACFDFQKSFL